MNSQTAEVDLKYDLWALLLPSATTVLAGAPWKPPTHEDQGTASQWEGAPISYQEVVIKLFSEVLQRVSVSVGLRTQESTDSFKPMQHLHNQNTPVNNKQGFTSFIPVFQGLGIMG